MEDRTMNQKGQVALIVLLVSAVALTFGLSVSRKTVTETRIESDEESLKQAFNAAESGVEYYLSTGLTQYSSPDGRSRADVTVEDLGADDVLDFEEYTIEGRYTYFWLVGHDDDGIINYGNFYEGTAVDICINNDFAGSMVMNYFYQDAGGNYRSRRFVTNYGSGANVIPNPSSLELGTCSAGTRGVRINLVAGSTPLLVAVSPIFSGGRIVLENVGGARLMSQGEEISSTGKVGEVAALTEVSRKVSVGKRYLVPGFMMEALTASGQILN